MKSREDRSTALTRRQFLRGMEVLMLSAAIPMKDVCGTPLDAAKAQRPNVLIIITHDTGRHLGCYGRGVDTPNLDRLAKEGVKFTHAFCTSPQCSPSRGSLQTGMMPHCDGLIGLVHRGFRLRPDVSKLPALLSKAGYSTHLFGLQHEARDPQKELGYQHVHHEGGNSIQNTPPYVMEFLAKSPQQPFFVMLGSGETHRQWPKVKTPPEGVKVPPWLPDAPEIQEDTAGLNELVRRVDRGVGQILDALDKSGLADNTLVIFTTDHGASFPGAKGTLFDPGIEISLLARGPKGFNGGRTIDALVSNIDIAPTVLSLCGAPVPCGMTGTSLLPLAQGKVERVHDRIFIENNYHSAYDPMRGVRTDEFKYIHSFEKRPLWLAANTDGNVASDNLTKEWFRVHRPEVFQTPRPAEMLFDLTKDPWERKNVADDPKYAKTLAELRKQVNEWMRETSDPLLKGPMPAPKGARITPYDSWGSSP